MYAGGTFFFRVDNGGVFRSTYSAHGEQLR